MIYLLVIVMFCVPSVFSYFDNTQGYLTSRDFLILSMSYLIFTTCDIRKWKLKSRYSILFMASCCMVLHNVSVDYLNLPVSWSLASITALIAFSITVYVLLAIRFDNLPNHEIQPGNIYEIIGRPRNDLQFLLFIFTGGRGGTYAITDGVDYIFMSRDHGQSVKIPLLDKHLINRKCIMIGTVCPHNTKLFSSKYHVNFRLWRNCHWLSTGFKNV